jgi:hypothetical protein
VVTLALSASTSSTPDSSNSRAGILDWPVDSGATRHLTPYRELLHNIRNLDTPQLVKNIQGSYSQCYEVGDVLLLLPGHESMILYDVRYAPSVFTNLFSVPAAANHGAVTTFGLPSSDQATIQQGSYTLLSKRGEQYHGMYGFTAVPGGYSLKRAAPAPAAAMTAANNSQESPQLWHRRFGHLGYDNLARLPSMVSGMHVQPDQLKAATAHVCEPCVMGKQTRLPFPAWPSDALSDASHPDTQPLSLLHTDVMGPMQVKSLGNRQYVLTVLDDSTSYSIAIPTLSKSDVSQELQLLITMLEPQSGRTVRAIRSDGGGEYISKDLHTFLAGKGIVHQTTQQPTHHSKMARQKDSTVC